jgi:hypothetical protein
VEPSHLRILLAEPSNDPLRESYHINEHSRD